MTIRTGFTASTPMTTDKARPQDAAPTPPPVQNDAGAAEVQVAAPDADQLADSGEEAVRTKSTKDTERGQEDTADITSFTPSAGPEGAAETQDTGDQNDGTKADAHWQPPKNKQGLGFGSTSMFGGGNTAEADETAAALTARTRAALKAATAKADELNVADEDNDNKEVEGGEQKAATTARILREQTQMQQKGAVLDEQSAIIGSLKTGRKGATSGPDSNSSIDREDPVKDEDSGTLLADAEGVGFKNQGLKQREDEERKAQNDRRETQERSLPLGGQTQTQPGTGGPAPSGKSETTTVGVVEDKPTVTPQQEVASRFSEFKVGQDKTLPEHVALAHQGLSPETAQAARNITEGRINQGQVDDAQSGMKRPDVGDATRVLELERVGKTPTVGTGELVDHPIEDLHDHGPHAQGLEATVDTPSGSDTSEGVRYASVGNVPPRPAAAAPFEEAWQAVSDSTASVLRDGRVEHEGTIGGARVWAGYDGDYRSMHINNFQTANGLYVDMRSQFQPGTGNYGFNASFRDRNNNTLRHRADGKGGSAWSMNDQPVSDSDAEDYLWQTKPPIGPKQLFPFMGMLGRGVNNPLMRNYLNQQAMQQQMAQQTPFQPAAPAGPAPFPPLQKLAYGDIQKDGVALFQNGQANPKTAGWYPLQSQEQAEHNYNESLSHVMADHSADTGLSAGDKQNLRDARSVLTGIMKQAQTQALADVGGDKAHPDFYSKMDFHTNEALNQPDFRQPANANPVLQNLAVRARQRFDATADHGQILGALEKGMPGLSGRDLAVNLRQQEMHRAQLMGAGQTAHTSGTQAENFAKFNQVGDFYMAAADGKIEATAEQVQTGKTLQTMYRQIDEQTTNQSFLAAGEPIPQTAEARQQIVAGRFIDYLARQAGPNLGQGNPGFANIVGLAQGVVAASQQ